MLTKKRIYTFQICTFYHIPMTNYMLICSYSHLVVSYQFVQNQDPEQDPLPENNKAKLQNNIMIELQKEEVKRNKFKHDNIINDQTSLISTLKRASSRHS